MPVHLGYIAFEGECRNLEYHGLYMAWNTDASPRHTLYGLKTQFLEPRRLRAYCFVSILLSFSSSPISAS